MRSVSPWRRRSSQIAWWRPSVEQLAATAADEHAIDDQVIVRVADRAQACHWSIRHLQRLFADHVGVIPKWTIRRYRLVNAAERVARHPTSRRAEPRH